MWLPSLFLINLFVKAHYAYPSSDNRMGRLYADIVSRQDTSEQHDSFEMIGDLRPEYNDGSGGPTTDVGKAIADILKGSGNPQSDKQWQGGISNPGNVKCRADKCCVWRHIALDMEKMFRGQSNRCTAEARAAVRLGFHDAGTWSKFTEDYGGADGSIILSGLSGQDPELARKENLGLQHIADVMVDWYNKYREYGVGMADLIQMGANVATVVCPLGPRIRSFVGRQDSSRPAVNDLLPDVMSDADTLLGLFANKTINTHGLVALVGAHTTSQQHFVEPLRAGDPQDSTPGVWDVKFYAETTGSAPPRVFKFPSDVKLSQHQSAQTEWTKFANEQSHWNDDYAREYIRLSLLGVNNINGLTECSHVLPPVSTKGTTSDDQAKVNRWLQGGESKKVSDDIEAGKKVS